jgi:restriction system protein
LSSATPWIVSLVAVLAIGGAATAWIRTVLRRRDETAAGIVALSAMSWREFIGVVLETLARRGYTRVIDRSDPAGDGEYTLSRDGRNWLLLCKHGSAFVLGNATVNELASDIRLHNAAGGLLVTQGRIADEARAPAKLQHIELLDGATLWPEMRELLPAETSEAIRAAASQRARQRVLLSWLGALLAGVVVFMAMPAPREEVPAAAVAPVEPVPIAPEPAPVAAAPVDPVPDAATLETQRRDVANAISTLAMVDRAVWSTNSTLEVILLDPGSDAIAAICPLIERYPALASSRIQLTPPPGSGVQVRFRQCRSY